MKILFVIYVSVTLPVLCIMVHCIIQKNRSLHELKSLSADRLRYIRMLLETVYLYKHDTSHLLNHLQTEMTIKRFLSYHIVDDRCEKLYPAELKCSKNDKLLYMLHKEGFSTRELCILFQLNNLNTVYVKCSRMNKTLHKEPETATVKETGEFSESYNS